jgi:gluconolactonase
MDALASGYGLIEGPVWDPEHGLYWSDVQHGGVHRLARSGAVTTVLPHRRGIGGIARHADGGLVVGGRNIAWKSLTDDRGAVLLEADAIAGAIGFNDLTTDAAGRIYVGSLAYRVFSGDAPRPGHLHVIDLDGRARTIADGVLLTNGLGFSPDGRRLYHSDSRAGLVRVYDVADDGSVGPWRALAQVTGVPDGLAVASDGSVWVALADGSAVLALEPDGRERGRLPVPLPMVTSVCFGGDDLRDLYVVTGSRGGPSDRCGTVYRTRVDVPGIPRPLARVAHGTGAEASR